MRALRRAVLLGIPHARVDDARRRRDQHDALRKISVLGDDGQIVPQRVGPELRVGWPQFQIRCMRNRRAGLQGGNARQVLVEEKAPHATGSNGQVAVLTIHFSRTRRRNTLILSASRPLRAPWKSCRPLPDAAANANP